MKVNKKITKVQVQPQHLDGFTRYIGMLGYVAQSFEYQAANFVTTNRIVPVAWRRFRVDSKNYLNQAGAHLYREFVMWTKEEYADMCGVA